MSNSKGLERKAAKTLNGELVVIRLKPTWEYKRTMKPHSEDIENVIRQAIMGRLSLFYGRRDKDYAQDKT